MDVPNTDSRLEHQIAEVRTLIARHGLLESVARRQQTPRSGLLEEMQRRQNLVELEVRLRSFHPADIARILESVPPEDRAIVWGQLQPIVAGQALVEVSPSIRDSLIEATPSPRLFAILSELDVDDLRYLSESVPEPMLTELSTILDARDRTWVEDSRSFPEGSAARLMTQDVLSLPIAATVEEAVSRVRQLGALPAHTDRLFVVDARNLLVGAVTLGALVVAAPSASISAVMDGDIRRFHLYDDAEVVATAFERYDLLSAPVVDDRGKLIGRVTADSVMDFIRASSENNVLGLAGLRAGEDLFAPVWYSARNRWPWLAVNLATAFIASRVIGGFEGAIQQLVPLAALMPIVASVGGNTGNQTVALVVRALALDQLQSGSTRHLLRKELTVGLLNGALWGTLVGLFATVVYRSLALGAVMTTAVLLNLLIAAVVGVIVPLVLSRAGRDPAQGSSVMLTFATDCMGFFLFLGLADVFLL
jgi:magnesium transporter